MITNKTQETCPGFGEFSKGVPSYAGAKFEQPDTFARNSDPIYDSIEKVQPAEQEDPSEDPQIAIY